MTREKKSWREIDRTRDRSRGRTRKDDRDRLERALDDSRFKERYLQEAEKLFMGAKGKPEHSRALMAIRNAYGTAGFKEAVKNYMETYGTPDDWGTLLLLLDLKKEPEIVCQAINRLCELAEEKGPAEKKGFMSKLSVLSLTAKDPEVQEEAELALAEFA
ncbi:MAG TPA: hypothetical protein EYP57_01880 [Thermodesulfobacteriaceae bacterium]|nr:hypothetical protein [Thermodesulfobacteriaceae bacterium]